MPSYPALYLDYSANELNAFVVGHNTQPQRGLEEMIEDFERTVLVYLHELLDSNRNLLYQCVVRIREEAVQASFMVNQHAIPGTWHRGIDADLQKFANQMAESGWRDINIAHTAGVMTVDQLQQFNALHMDALLEDITEQSATTSLVAAAQSHHASPQPVQTANSAMPDPSALPVPQSDAFVRPLESSADRDGDYVVVPAFVHPPQYRGSPSEWSAA
jgi:hypothetical protein